MSAMELPDDAPAPRLCHLVKWTDFDGYGFNLHAEKSKPGQFIGKVDDGSPAEAAGLRPGDRIVEVNGVNIANENHKQVVERVKSVMNETKLLVVDDETDKWHKDRKLVVRGTQSNVKYIKTPVPRYSSQLSDEEEEEEEDDDEPLPVKRSSPQESPKQINSVNSNTVVEQVDEDDNQSYKSAEEESHSLSQGNSKTASVTGSNASSPSSDRRSEKELANYIHSEEGKPQELIKNGSITLKGSSDGDISQTRETPSPSPSPILKTSPITESPKPSYETTNGASSESGSGASPVPPASVNGREKLNLNMTAQEMRALLASRKKYDPKKESMDFRQKYAIIQDM